MAAVDYFLKLGDIAGESTDAKHKDWIVIESFSWGLGEAQTGEAGKPARAGKVSVHDISFTKTMDKSSPLLMKSTAAGQAHKHGILIGLRGGGEQRERHEFLIIKMDNILISSYQTGGSGGDVVPTDSFSLNFGKIEFEYKPQDPTGKTGTPVSAGFDVKEGRA